MWSDYLKIFTEEVQSHFKPFQSRRKGRKIFNFRKEPEPMAPLKPAQRPSDSTIPLLACFLSILRTDENSGEICDQIKVEEEMVQRHFNL